MAKARMTASEIEAFRNNRLNSDLTSVLSSQEGKRVMIWILESLCGVNREATAHSDALTYRAIGRQSVGHEIIARINSENGVAYGVLLLEAVKLETAFEDLYELADEDDD